MEQQHPGHNHAHSHGGMMMANQPKFFKLYALLNCIYCKMCCMQLPFCQQIFQLCMMLQSYTVDQIDNQYLTFSISMTKSWPKFLQRIVAGYFSLTIIFTIFVMYFEIYKIIPLLKHQESIYQFLVVVLIITIITFFATYFCEPGSQNKPEYQQDYKNIMQKRPELVSPQFYCTFCKIPRICRSHHCNFCEGCVPKWEKHSFIFNRCIGARNLMIWLCFMISYSTFLITSLVIIFFPKSEKFKLNIAYAFIILILGFTAYNYTKETFIHLLQLVYNITSREVELWQRLPYLWKNQNREFFNPFDRGICHNIREQFEPFVGQKQSQDGQNREISDLDTPQSKKSEKYINWVTKKIFTVLDIPNSPFRQIMIQEMEKGGNLPPGYKYDPATQQIKLENPQQQQQSPFIMMNPYQFMPQQMPMQFGSAGGGGHSHSHGGVPCSGHGQKQYQQMPQQQQQQHAQPFIAMPQLSQEQMMKLQEGFLKAQQKGPQALFKYQQEIRSAVMKAQQTGQQIQIIPSEDLDIEEEEKQQGTGQPETDRNLIDESTQQTGEDLEKGEDSSLIKDSSKVNQNQQQQQQNQHAHGGFPFQQQGFGGNPFMMHQGGPFNMLPQMSPQQFQQIQQNTLKLQQYGPQALMQFSIRMRQATIEAQTQQKPLVVPDISDIIANFSQQQQQQPEQQLFQNLQQQQQQPMGQPMGLPMGIMNAFQSFGLNEQQIQQLQQLTTQAMQKGGPQYFMQVVAKIRQAIMQSKQTGDEFVMPQFEDLQIDQSQNEQLSNNKNNEPNQQTGNNSQNNTTTQSDNLNNNNNSEQQQIQIGQDENQDLLQNQTEENQQH